MYDPAIPQTGFYGFAVEVTLEQFGKGDLHPFGLAVGGAVRNGFPGFDGGSGKMKACFQPLYDPAEGKVEGIVAIVLGGARGQDDAGVG